MQHGLLLRELLHLCLLWLVVVTVELGLGLGFRLRSGSASGSVSARLAGSRLALRPREQRLCL
jgi:hypothetical protein